TLVSDHPRASGDPKLLPNPQISNPIHSSLNAICTLITLSTATDSLECGVKCFVGGEEHGSQDQSEGLLEPSNF
ncbi:hypothetical protein E4T56_gene5046, partial [Termitomyces sp. T112]